jgi:hypothetical protein
MHQNCLNKIHLLEISKSFLRTLQGSISLIGEFPSHFDLKNMILTNTKDFSWKKWPKFARFQRKKVPNLQILMFSSLWWMQFGSLKKKLQSPLNLGKS